MNGKVEAKRASKSGGGEMVHIQDAKRRGEGEREL